MKDATKQRDRIGIHPPSSPIKKLLMASTYDKKLASNYPGGVQAYKEMLKPWQDKMSKLTDAFVEELSKKVYPNVALRGLTMELYAKLNYQGRCDLVFVLSGSDNTDAFAVALSNAWMDGYHGSILRAYSIEELVFFFERADKNILMTTEERYLLENLPDVVQVYRGVPASAETSHGMSWTLSKKVAEDFAMRLKDNGLEDEIGRVIEDNIPKACILAYFNDRQEEEIIIDPRKRTLKG